MENYRSLLKLLRIGSPTNCKHKALVFTDYTSDSSEIQRAQALVRGARKIFKSRTLKSFTSCNQRSLYTKFLSAERPFSLRYFNSGDALRKKTSKPRIRAEMLDGWEDVE